MAEDYELTGSFVESGTGENKYELHFDPGHVKGGTALPRLDVTVDVVTPAKRDTLTKDEAYVVLIDNSYWFSTKQHLVEASGLRTNRSREVQLTLSPKAKTTLADLPDTVRLELRQGDDTLAHISLVVPLYKFTLPLFVQPSAASAAGAAGAAAAGGATPRPSAVSNVLFFGLVGCGKSSLVNTCFSALSPEKQAEFALSGGAQDHVSREFQGYRLLQFLPSPAAPLPTNMRLWDTWGLGDSGEYDDGQFTSMLAGDLDSHFHMSDRVPLAQDFDEENQAAARRERNKIECVVFCVPFNEVDTANELFTSLRGFVALATRRRVSCVVAITKCDLGDDAWPPAAPAVLPDTIAAKIGVVAKHLNIPENRVFPTRGYTKEPGKHAGIDRHALNLLIAATERAGAAKWVNMLDD